MTEPLLPVAAHSQAPYLARAQPDAEPELVFVHSDALLDLKTSTCVQCGLNEAGPPQRRVFESVPAWVYLGLLGNLFTLAFLYFVGRKRVPAILRLCPDCAAADRRGRLMRAASLLTIPSFPLIGAALAGTVAGAEWLFGGASAGLVAAIAAVIAAVSKTRDDVIETKHIDTKAGTVTLLAGASWSRVLAAEAQDALAISPR